MAASPREFTPLTAPSAPPQAARRQLLTRVLAVVGVVVVLAVGIAVLSFEHSATNSQHVRAAATSSPKTLSTPAFSGSSDAIVAMPGIPSNYSSRLFSGYLPIHTGAEGFYFLAESQSENPEKDPVLLWLNGGPGASSLAGCFSENGPLLVNDDGKTLRLNEFGWNKNANMLCIESPIGVGFSYNASGVYHSDDVAQADDLYWILQAFFGKFPWLRANDFIITGESYGGVYVPMTAKRIVEGNQNAGADAKINLKKFAVGNGVNEFMTLSKVSFAYYHGLISTDEYMKVGSVCPALLTPGAKLSADASEQCLEAVESVVDALQDGDINNYNIYAKCVGGNALAGIQSMIDELKGPLQAVPHPIDLNITSCLEWSELMSYFNLPDVRTAFNTKREIKQWNNIALTSANLDLASLLNKTANELEPIIKNKVLQYEATQGMETTPLWKFLIDNGVHGVIYHGDVDMACDFIGGLWGVESLKLPREQPRASWSIAGDDQTAGFVEDFGPMKYVTIKGAGHMVPTDKPREAKAMLDQFVLQ